MNIEQIAKQCGAEFTDWLHEDSARCFELMVEHDLFPNVYNNGTDNPFYSVSGYTLVETKDHNNDKPLATRIAILKALLAKDVE